MQEADNVLVIVRKRDPDGTVRKYLHVSLHFKIAKKIANKIDR